MKCGGLWMNLPFSEVFFFFFFSIPFEMSYIAIVCFNVAIVEYCMGFELHIAQYQWLALQDDQKHV